MSGAVSKHLTANKPDTLTVSGLAGDKTYYVRVRSYTNRNGQVYYSAWSDIKSIKTAATTTSQRLLFRAFPQRRSQERLLHRT